MKGITICVDYWDLLSITLPWNRHHFDEFMVVTSSKDATESNVAFLNQHQCRVVVTDAFYQPGAVFNKWLALEQGLDMLGRDGWLCIMDADVLWPKTAPSTGFLTEGHLYTPRRRILSNPSSIDQWHESYWHHLPLYRENEFAGYTQIFHADDPVLGKPPWHELNWRHAGGGDSMLQNKWAKENKVRPGWEVLHLGQPGQNWYGRATPYLDGTVPEGATERRAAMASLFSRHRGGSYASERYDPV